VKIGIDLSSLLFQAHTKPQHNPKNPLKPPTAKSKFKRLASSVFVTQIQLVEGFPQTPLSKNRREAVFALSRFASAGNRADCLKP